MGTFGRCFTNMLENALLYLSTNRYDGKCDFRHCSLPPGERSLHPVPPGPGSRMEVRIRGAHEPTRDVQVRPAGHEVPEDGGPHAL